ncbi:MAG: DUF6524 family protein [Rhodospirillales bacterium]|nr:DUF6524 family protein [Rhodospirillales bacterium]
MARPSFSPASFLLRWLVALVLVFGTFNPTDYSYYHWVFGFGDAEGVAEGGGPAGGGLGGSLPLKILVGVALAILYVIYLRATWRSIGPIGIALAAALLGALVWLMIDIGLLNLDRPTVMTWVILFILATVLAIGISWSHIRRRVTGQADMDDVDE